ncbi:MAG: Ada metal-binding domain-containing protein, partial [Sphingomonas sp.]
MRPTDTESDPRWPRIVARDRAADGLFWYSVLTTGVYCRPSCPSRTANPANVTIHATLGEARATGARACLRCRPDEVSADEAGVARALALVEAAETAPSLRALATEPSPMAGITLDDYTAATVAVVRRAARLGPVILWGGS